MKLGKPVDLLPNMTTEEKAVLAEQEKAANAPEKRQLEGEANVVPVVKKARSGAAA